MVTRVKLLTGLTLVLALATGAEAQQGSGPTIGSTDSSKTVSGTQDQNASYNRLVSALGSGPSAKVKHQTPVPATIADLKVGAALRDIAGTRVGTIADVDAQGATIDTGRTKIKIPMFAFGKDEAGVLLGITAARFNELISKAHASSEGHAS